MTRRDARRKSILALLGLVALTGCGESRLGGRGEAPLSTVQRADCPRVGVLADAADLTRFRPGSGEDVTDIVMDARVVGVAGNCDLGRRVTVVDLAITIDTTRGPAASGRALDVPYFIAVLDRDGNIIDRAMYNARFEFPPNRSRVRLTGEEIRLNLPTPEGVRGRDFGVSVGLQVNEQELAFNRRRGPR